MQVLIACEESGTVRDAFLARGHDALSCDLEETRNPGPHYRGDVRDLLAYPWDLIIAFPPCTHLCVSGARWFPAKRANGAQHAAVSLVMTIARADCPRIAIENPLGVLSTLWRQPDQILQPWEHGHGEVKSTCLWLKGLRPLVPSRTVDGREPRIWKMGPSENRSRDRSVTFRGVADAMAEQWGNPERAFHGEPLPLFAHVHA